MSKDRGKILLCSMPDCAMAFRRVGSMPNLGLPSIAASVPENEVRILDLQAVFYGVGRRVLKELQNFEPQIVGFSAMSFQFATAVKLAGMVREYDPSITIVLGGYHVSMDYKTFSGKEAPFFDFLVRGEGEMVFKNLVTALYHGRGDYSHIAGLSYQNGGWVHNAGAPLSRLADIPLPKREARGVNGFYLFGKKIDTVETSRGCTLPCNFCSISRMYGPFFRTYPLQRVIEDISVCVGRGSEMIFFVDDNITLDVSRLKLLCREIIKNGLNSVEYLTQVSVQGMAGDKELAGLMREAGFSIVFMGIENVSPESLKEMKKGDIRNATKQAVSLCRTQGIVVVGGFIAGLPNDGPEEIRTLFRAARRLQVDHVIVQCLTPYPNTELREKLAREGLVENLYDYSRYNGYICNVRTRKMKMEKLNRILNWENIKLYFDPRFISSNRLLQRDNARKWKGRVFVNSLEHFPAFFLNRLFYSRHTL